MVLRAKPEKVEERERTRLALLRATLLLATRHGFAGLGLREVSRGAEIAPTSFYRHFADMEELGVALVDELVAPLLSGWLERTRVAIEASGQPVQALAEQAHQTLSLDRDLMRFVLAERVGAMVSCRRALRRELAKLSRGLGQQLGQQLGGAPLPDFVASAVLSLLLESLSQALELDEPDAASESELQSQLTCLLHEPLRKKP